MCDPAALQEIGGIVVSLAFLVFVAIIWWRHMR